MILDEKDIARLAKSGVKLTGANGQPISIKTPDKKQTQTELDCLNDIKSLLVNLVAKPESEPRPLPPVVLKAPDVIVKPPEVKFPEMPKPHKQIRKWHFELKKDQWGTTEIIATAIE